MARRPQGPWYRKSRDAWFITIDGTQHQLARGKQNIDEAWHRYHELMAAPRPETVKTDSVLAVIDLFLDWCQRHRAADTYEWYQQRLQRFTDTIPAALTVGEIRHYHLQQFIDGLRGRMDGSQTPADGTLRNYCRAVQRALAWAEQQGYIERSPLRYFEKPPAGKRETFVTPEEFQELLAVVREPNLRDLLLVSWETGARPQETLRLEAQHVDLDNARWLFPTPPKRHPMPRVVYLSEIALEITRRCVERYPAGHVFRNSRGKPWTTASVNCAFIQLQYRQGREKMAVEGVDVDESDVAAFAKTLAPDHIVKGERVVKTRSELLMEARCKLRNRMASSLAPKRCLYVLRHSFATRLLKARVDSLTVAHLLGHSDPSMLAKVYAHLNNPEYLHEQLRRASA